MDDTLKKEILTLIEATELRDYLMEQPEKLNRIQYAEIIAGAPVSLCRKRELLRRLNRDVPNDMHVSEMLHSLENAIEMLDHAKAPNYCQKIELLGYDKDTRSAERLDSFFPVRDMAIGKQVMEIYLSEDRDEDWTSRQWQVELYDLCAEHHAHGWIYDIPSPECRYTFSPEGEPQFFRPRIYNRYARAFYEGELNIPVPYQPGDVLYIDCRPYTPEPFYCLLTEVGDGCCDVWCLFPNPDGSIGHGALKHGHYHSPEYDFFEETLSPLYRAKRFMANCRKIAGL